MQRLFTLFVLFIMLYAVFFQRGEGQETNTAEDIVTNIRTAGSNLKEAGENLLLSKEDVEELKQPLEGNFIERSLSKVAINMLKTEDGQRFFEKLITVDDSGLKDPDYSIQLTDPKVIESIFKIRTIRQGAGKPCTCGHFVEIFYTLSRNGETIKEETLNYPLGSKNNLPVLATIVSGMKIGEVREARIPMEYSVTLDDSLPLANYSLRVALESISSKSLIDPEEIKIFDDVLAYKTPYFCGDMAQFNAKITQIDGKLIYNSKQSNEHITMALGDSSYPLIFSYSLFNKAPIGTRTVIAQGKYFDSLMGVAANQILSTPLKPEEYYFLELSDFKRVKSVARSIYTQEK